MSAGNGPRDGNSNNDDEAPVRTARMSQVPCVSEVTGHRATGREATPPRPCTSLPRASPSCGVARLPRAAVSAAGIRGHRSQPLPSPLGVTGCRLCPAPRQEIHSRTDCTHFCFYQPTQMGLSGSCFPGDLYLLSFPGLFSTACHSFPSRV